MVDNRKSSADFTKAASIGTMTRGPVERPPADPIAEAIETRRQMAGYKMIEQAASESSAAATRAETDRIKAEAERRAAEAQIQGGGAQNDQMAFLYKQIESLQDRYEEARAAQNEAVMAALNDRMTMLQEELKDARATSPADPLGAAIHTIEQTNSLMDKLRPPAPVIERVPTVDVSLEKWKLATEYEREKMRLDYQERAQIKQAELAMQREIKEQEIAAIRAKAEMEQRFFADTVPKLLEVGQQILAAVTQGRGVGAATSVPTAATPAVAAATMPLPAGVKRMACQQCGAPILYREEFGGAFCQNCGAEFGQGAGQQQEGPVSDHAATEPRSIT